MSNLKTLKKIFAFVFLVCLTLLMGAYIPALADDGNARTGTSGENFPNEIVAVRSVTGAPSSNYNRQEYRYKRWSAPVTSYLVKYGDGGVMRVEEIGKSIAVEYFNAQFDLASNKNIEFELPLFGGFYEGKDNYFLVFGQENPDEDDNKEVVRVVRYTKDWERVDAASLYGANTCIPFRAGSLRMVQYGDYLYILTCHQMYAKEGVNHQANLIFSVNIPEMKISDSVFDISNINHGYVSHSFNQFIALDEDRLLTVNHGDAYPRTVELTQYPEPAGQEKFTGECKSISLLQIKGEVGDNDTGVGVGGFAVSDTSYLVAGNSIDQDDPDIPFDGQRNIFLSVTPRGPVGDFAPKLLWVTNYAYDAGVSISVPHLTKITDRYFVLTWVEGNKFCYQFRDGSGEPLSEIYRSDEGVPSDCQPIVMKRLEDDRIRRFVCWYTTNNSSPVFFFIPVPPVRVTAVELDQSQMSLNVGDFGSLKETVLPDDADDDRVTWASSDPATVSVSDGRLSALKLGTATVTATTKDGGHTASCTVTVSGIRINDAVFPDPTFRKYIVDTFDKDNDGVLSGNEHGAIKAINVGSKQISSIKGIEHFSGLSSLDCNDNDLTGLDVSGNTSLTELNCSGNKLTELDVSKNTALTQLDCGDNSLSHLNVSLDTALTTLRCDNNELKDLDVSKNAALTLLDCSNNELASLDISANIRLDFDGGGFKADGNSREVVDGMKVTKFPGFDLNKIKSCQGGEFLENGKFKFDEGANEVTYVYDVGQGRTVTFTFRKSPYVFGDVNGDEEVNSIDARWLLQIVSGNRALAPEKEDVADVNSDGKVNIIDARWILQASSGSRTL